MEKIKSSEITPQSLFLTRRDFITGLGAVAAGAAFLSACQGTGISSLPPASEPADKPNSYKDITSYNNFYEFSFGKDDVAQAARNFKTSPWTVVVSGLVANPRTYALEDLIKRFPPEERIYRHRCVEAWSMVIPWLGFPLAKLLQTAQPTSEAKYVRFETLYDPAQMPVQADTSFDWPYAEGLRLDEAMNDLSLLANGLYGEMLLSQNGAPFRLVVPWKYGFKSIKSIVKIELVADMPVSFWMAASPDEYGFYANVNPDVPHPRWSQTTERRIGEYQRRQTVLFNGYGDEVAHLYQGLDLRKFF